MPDRWSTLAVVGLPRTAGTRHVAYLAYEVFDLLDAEFTLADMQSSVLVPLELELSARPEVSRWSPRRWVDAVDNAIRNESSTLGCEPTM